MSIVSEFFCLPSRPTFSSTLNSFFDTPGLSLQAQVGVGFQREEKEGEKTDGSIVGWQVRYTQKFFNSDMEVFHNQTVYQNLEGRENVVAITETGVRYEFTDDIYFNIQLNYDVDSEPAEGANKENLTLQFGAGIEF